MEGVEKDTLGVDACIPRRIHADVLEASERTFERYVATQGHAAEAPRPPEATNKVPNAATPKSTAVIVVAPALLLSARLATEELVPPSVRGGERNNEVMTVKEAESAWVLGRSR